MAGLELLNPRGLWLLAGAVPIIVFYILKVRRARVRVPSTWLWAGAQRDLLAKQPFRRLVAELPLLLQLLALAALAIALARPAMRGGKIVGDHVAIVVDTSASMGAGKRMEEARRAATAVVGALEPGADAIVIEAAKEPKVVTPLERDARHLDAAIAALAARDVEGDLASAVALAADRLRTLGGKKRVVVVTDGALAHDAPLVAAGVDAQVVSVAAAGDDENTGIVRVDVRGGTDSASKKDEVQVFAMLENFGKRPRDAFVTLSLEGRADPIASRRVLVAPKEKLPVVLTFAPQPTDFGAPLTVQIAPGDTLPVDDVAYGRVPAGRRMPVTLATPGGGYSWTARALEADEDVDLQRLTLQELAKVNVDPDALVVVEGACPDPVPGHDVLVIGPPTGACFGMDVLPKVEQPALTSWEPGDARLRFLTLDGVHVARATPLGAEGTGASLVRAGKVTVVGDASFPGRTVTIVGFDVGDSDWPLKASFVLFVRNVVELAKLHRAQGAAGPAHTGDPLRVAVPPGVTTVHVEGPHLPDHELSAKGGFAVVPAVERAGFYRVRWTDPHVGSTLVPANLASERESDLAPRPVAVAAGTSPEAAATPAASRVADAHHEWGTWLALAAAALLLFDLFWLTRRPRPVAASAASAAVAASAAAASAAAGAAGAAGARVERAR